MVVTGGEPLLQQRDLVPWRGLKSEGKRIEVETSGTILPDGALSASVDQWNVSPKLASSGNESGAREVPAALTWFAAQSQAYFKYVVTAPDDLAEVQGRWRATACRRSASC